MQRFLMSVMAVVFAFGLLWPAGIANSAPGITDGEPPTHYVLRAGYVFAEGGNAAGWIKDAWIEVEDGKILRIGHGTTPGLLPVVDRPNSWVMPGLVSTESRIFIGSDPDGIGPRYVAADKFNPYADFHKSWEKGITSARLGVPGDRFVSGVGSVVKFGGTPETAEVLQRFADLSVYYNRDKGRGEKDVKNIPFPSSSDVPYEAQPEHKPHTRLGRDAALREALEGAKANSSNPRAMALASFLALNRPIRLEARRADDIVQAINMAKSLKSETRIYLNGLDEATSVIDSIVESGLPLVLDMDNNLTRLDDKDFDLVRPWHRDPRAAGALEARGVFVVIGGTGADLLYSAAMAVGGGMDAKVALQAITSRPASLLGVSKRVGSIAPGKDADLLVLNGNPLAGGSHVQEVFVGGHKAWTRPRENRPLLVRAGKIYDGKGGVFLNSEVLIEDGKIVGIGQGVPHPPNARVVEAGPDAVVTPGFVDSHGQLGLGSERSSAGTDLSLADVMNVSRPGFAHVARSGVTTVVVAPATVGSSGSQMIAIKTMADDKGIVGKSTVGVKLRVGGSVRSVRKNLTAAFSRGKKYYDAWKKYEDELAKFKANGSKTVKSSPAPAKKVEKKKAPAPKVTPTSGDTDELSGTWRVSLSGGPIPNPMHNLSCKIRLSGTNVVGTMTNPMDLDEEVTFAGAYDNKTLVAEVDIVTPFGDTTLTAKLDKPEHLVGTVDLGGVMEITFEGTRTKKGAPKITVKARAKKTSTKAVKATGPKKPRFDPRQEPWRAIFAGKAGLLIEINGGPQIRAASQVAAGYGIPIMMLGAQGILTVLGDLEGQVSVALGNNFNAVVEKKIVFLPGRLERADIPLAFASGHQTGAALLPRLVKSAVRSGLGQMAALRALTWDAAKQLRLHDTVGALKKGLDGDLLIFNGEPFDARTRLKSVFIRGQEVKK